MFRSCQIIIRELCCSLQKLYYNIHNLIRFLQTRCCGSMQGTTKLPDDDLTRSKHVGVILSVFKVFYMEVI